MKLASHSSSPQVLKTRRTSTYALPLVALPSVLGMTPAAIEGLPPAPHVRLHARSLLSGGAAMSPLGAALDRKISAAEAGLALKQSPTASDLSDLVFAKAPKRVVRHRMKVVKRERNLGFVETRAEVDSLLVANDF